MSLLHPWGVLSFKLKSGEIVRCPQGERSYQNSVNARLINGDKLQTIKFDGLQWNVGSSYISEDGSYIGRIVDFDYNTNGEWHVIDEKGRIPFLKDISLIEIVK